MWVKAYFLYAAAVSLWLGIRYRKDWRSGWLRWILSVCLPVAGLLLPPFGSERRLSKRNAQNPDFRFDSIKVEETGMPDIYDKEVSRKEANVVPLEEALLLNDPSTRRQAMIDLLKRDTLEYLDVLQLAVANEDTETSHYAVSAIFEVKRKLLLAIQDLSVQYEQNKDDPHLLRSFAEVLKSYLASGFLDERTILNYRHTYIEVLGRLIQIEPDTPDYYIRKIDAEIDMRELSEAEKTALAFLERLPDQEDAYMMLLKVYYTRRSYEQVRTTLNRMLDSPIRFSNRALSVVRFWLEVSAHGKEPESQASPRGLSDSFGRGPAGLGH